MKKYSFLFLAMMGIFSLTWTGCTDSVDYTPAEAVEGQGVYFPKSLKTSYTLKDVKGQITFDVYRTNTAGSFDAPLTVSVTEGAANLFNIPTVVPFAEGQDSTSMTISFDKLVRGTNYEVSLSFADATVYGNSSIKMNFIYPKAPEYKWQVVSTKAVYIDNLFAMFGASDISFVKDLDKSLTVEKVEGLDIYRFTSPYDNDYFGALFGLSIFPSDFKFPYIILDGEKYKSFKKWYIKATNLGFQMVNGEGPKFDPSWNTFGSVAGNLSTGDGPIPPDSPDFPLGTFDRKTQCFDFGVTYHNLGNHGLAVNKASFKLYLDPSKMEPNFDRDFTWVDVEGSTGEFTSELAGGEKAILTLQQAKEDQTFYRFPQLYSETGNLYFYIKDNVVTLPKKQNTGLDTFGNPIFMEGTPGKSSYNPETKEIALGVTFYLADANGEKKADLVSGVEKFLWGHTELDQLALGKSLDDYVGTWGVNFSNGEKNVTLPVTFTKAGDKTLVISGLSGTEEYDDHFAVKYSASTGLLTMYPAETTPIQGFPVTLAFFDPIEFNILLDEGSDKLIGGFISDSTIKFLNDLENKAHWYQTAYVVNENGKMSFLTGFWNDLEFSAVKNKNSVKPYELAPAFKAIVPLKNDKFKVTLYKGDSKVTSLNGLCNLKVATKNNGILFE